MVPERACKVKSELRPASPWLIAGRGKKKGTRDGCPQIRPARGGGDGAGHKRNAPDPNQFHPRLKKISHPSENA